MKLMNVWACYALCLGLCPSAAAEPLRLMLAVGQNEGLANERPLRFAHRDALTYAKTMQELGGIEPVNTVLLEETTVEGLESALHAIQAKAKAHTGEVTLFFYYSGHGDRNALHLKQHRYPIEALNTKLSQVDAELRIAVIDACRSPDDTQPKGFRTASHFSVHVQAPKGLQGVVTIRSSSDGEDSQESGRLQGAVFTHYLLTALRGAADRDDDDRVTLSEAYGYAYDQTVQRSAASTANVMHPSVEMNLEGAGRLTLTTIAPQTAALRISPDKDTRYLLYRRPAGVLTAEVWARSDTPVEIPLAPGEYLVQRRSSKRSGAVIARIAVGATRTVDEMTFQPISEDILAAKGGQLRLWEHTVSAGYTPGLSHAGTYSHSAQVRYGFGPPAWRFDVGLDVGQQSYDTKQDSRTERWVGGQLRAGCHHCIGSMDVLAGLRGHYIQQRLERRDARLAAAAGYLAPTEYDGLGIGPTAALRWSTAFAAQWAGVLEGQSSLLVVKEGSEWALRPSTGIGLFLRWSSDMGGY